MLSLWFMILLMEREFHMHAIAIFFLLIRKLKHHSIIKDFFRVAKHVSTDIIIFPNEQHSFQKTLAILSRHGRMCLESLFQWRKVS